MVAVHFFIIVTIYIFKSECALILTPKNVEVVYDAGDILLRCTHSPSTAIIRSIIWTYEKGKPANKSVATYSRAGNSRTQGDDYIGRAHIEAPVAGGTSSALLINDTRQGDIGVYTGDYNSAFEGDDFCEFTVVNPDTTTLLPSTREVSTTAVPSPETAFSTVTSYQSSRKPIGIPGVHGVCIPTRPGKNAGISCGAVILGAGVVLTVMFVGSMLKLWVLPWEKEMGKEGVAGNPMFEKNENENENENRAVGTLDNEESRNKLKTRKIIQIVCISVGCTCIAGGSLCLGLCIGLPLC